jgi:glycosyltransferase involved in cell wall biosynthesis
VRLLFLTSTPLDISRGSGTYVGIHTLAEALRRLGATVEFLTPRLHFPVYTIERIFYNYTLSWRAGSDFDATVGFDLDGFRLAGPGRLPHVASIKGVIADEVRFQNGATRLTMSVQARLERLHARRADFVMTTSRYAAERILQCYGVRVASIVPELIDLGRWRHALDAHPASPDPRHFTVLSVCRLYRRKRLDLLLEAAAQLRPAIPELRIRIVGSGPEGEEFRTVERAHGLGPVVSWLGDLSYGALAAEYNACDIFCLPSQQEGFGIVFLEAMAAGKPIVAAGAAAVPEVVPQGVLSESGSATEIAAALASLHADPARRQALAIEGLRRVEQFEAGRVARLFLSEIERLLGRG